MKEGEDNDVLNVRVCVGCIKSSWQSIQHQHKTA